MKQLLAFMAMMLFISIHAQNDAPSMVFDQVILDVEPGKMDEFSRQITEHNKQFHASEPNTVRVYNVTAGANTGKFIWNMGPCTFADMDKFDDSSAHQQHWVNNVMPTLKSMSGGTYWKFHPEFSNFQKDFKLNMLNLTFFDIKRGMGNWDTLKGIIEKITKVYHENYPNETYGIYSNMMGSTKEGRDLAVVGFMDNFAAMDENIPDFEEKYNAMHGNGSWDRDMKTWVDLTEGSENELWVFIPELSTGATDVMSTDRQ